MHRRGVHGRPWQPAVLAVVIAAFSLESPPHAAPQGLPADVLFEGSLASSTLHAILQDAPDRRAGHAGDDRAANRVGTALRGFGFSVSHDRWTDDGTALDNVVGRRPGLSERELVVLASRDATSVPDATGSAAHGYRAHRVVRDVLADPGSADITAGVAFDPLVMRAERWGLEILGPMSQSHALRGLGIEGWIEIERLKQVANIDKRAGRAALKAYDARQRATQLIDPNGLGALRWLWLATPGCGWWKGIEELS